MGRLDGTISLTGLPPHRGLILNLCLYPVSGPDSPAPHGGDPPAEAATDCQIVFEQVDLTVESQRAVWDLPFSLERQAGFYYLQVRAILFRSRRDGSVLAQAEQFFFAERPVPIDPVSGGQITLAASWPAEPPESLHFRGTISPQQAAPGGASGEAIAAPASLHRIDNGSALAVPGNASQIRPRCGDLHANFDSPATVTIGPSPRKVLRGTLVASIAILGCLGLVILALEFLAAAGLLGLLPVPPWLWIRRWAILCGAATLIAGFRGVSLLGAIFWRRPRVEIGPDGFADFGVLGHRARRFRDIEGPFAIIKLGWPFAVGPHPFVAYRLTDAFRQSTRILPPATFQGYDEAILICGELEIGAEDLANLLNQWKQHEERDS